MDYIIAPDQYETERFTLRSYQPGDGPLLREAVNSSYEYLKTFMEWAKPETTDEDEEQRVRIFRGRYLKAEDFTIGIFSPDSQQLLGGTGFHLRGQTPSRKIAEIGMWIRASEAGKGLGTAALEAMLRWGFSEWPWERLFWRCSALNHASAKVAEKAGMIREAHLRKDYFLHSAGEFTDLLVFGALRNEWSR